MIEVRLTGVDAQNYIDHYDDLIKSETTIMNLREELAILHEEYENLKKAHIDTLNTHVKRSEYDSVLEKLKAYQTPIVVTGTVEMAQPYAAHLAEQHRKQSDLETASSTKTNPFKSEPKPQTEIPNSKAYEEQLRREADEAFGPDDVPPEDSKAESGTMSTPWLPWEEEALKAYATDHRPSINCLKHAKAKLSNRTDSQIRAKLKRMGYRIVRGTIKPKENHA